MRTIGASVLASIAVQHIANVAAGFSDRRSLASEEFLTLAIVPWLVIAVSLAALVLTRQIRRRLAVFTVIFMGVWCLGLAIARSPEVMFDPSVAMYGSRSFSTHRDRLAWVAAMLTPAVLLAIEFIACRAGVIRSPRAVNRAVLWSLITCSVLVLGGMIAVHAMGESIHMLRQSVMSFDLRDPSKLTAQTQENIWRFKALSAATAWAEAAAVVGTILSHVILGVSFLIRAPRRSANSFDQP